MTRLPSITATPHTHQTSVADRARPGGRLWRGRAESKAVCEDLVPLRFAYQDSLLLGIENCVEAAILGSPKSCTNEWFRARPKRRWRTAQVKHCGQRAQVAVFGRAGQRATRGAFLVQALGSRAQRSTSVLRANVLASGRHPERRIWACQRAVPSRPTRLRSVAMTLPNVTPV